MATTRVEFTRAKAFKRQNSYVPLLEDFGDIDDADNLKRETAKARRSFKKDRKKLVSVVADCIKARFDADVHGAGSDNESTGKAPGQKGKTGANFNGMGMMGQNGQMMTGGGFIPPGMGMPGMPGMGIPGMPGMFPPMMMPQPQVITTTEGEKVIQNQDGTTTPVVQQPDGQIMVKQKDGTLTPISAM